MTPLAATVTASLPSSIRSRWYVPAFARRLASDAMFRKSMVSLLDQAVVSATSFAITVILGRLCGKPEVGLYYLALQAVLLARGVQEQLIASPYLVYGGRKQGHAAATYAGSSLVHEMSLLAAVMLTISLVARFGGWTPPVAELLWLLVGAAPLMLLREYIRQISFAELRVGEALAVDCGVATLQLSALGVAAYAGVLSTPLTFVLLSLGCGVAATAWIIRRRGKFVAERRAVVSDWFHNWRFGRWALASQLLGQTMPLVMPWIVAATHGQAATGTLGVGTTLIGFANMFVLGLSNFICPRAAQAFAAGGKRELVGVLKRAAGMYLAVLIPFAFAMLLAGGKLMAFVYGAEFADAGPIMAVLAFGAVANSLGVTAGNGLWAMEMPSANFRADVCALLVWILSTVLLIPLYGPLGAAVASSLGTTVGAVVRGWVLRGALRTQS